MNDDRKLMPALLDRQVSKADEDAFGHRHFAQALRSLVESERYDPPFSIGLLGGWGTGKSTIKDLYLASLQDDAQVDGSRLRRRDRIHTITFNAWRFGGKEQDIKRALLRQVFIELGGDDDALQSKLFSQTTVAQEQGKGWWEYTKELFKAWAMPIPALVVSFLLMLVLLWLLVGALEIEDDSARALIGSVFFAAYTYLLKNIKLTPIALHRPLTTVTPPMTSAEQYQDLLITQIAKYKAGESNSPGDRKGSKCQRLVVFVDDLDRLSSEEMVLGLDAVRTFMEIPQEQLPEGLGLVFVISCDEEKVADALTRGRPNGDMPGSVFQPSDARRYLDRIFQFRLEIPPFPRQDMRQYAVRQIEAMSELRRSLERKSVPIETLVDRMIHVGVKDPRNALQIVNAFAQSWWLAQKREVEGVGTDRPGGLHEGAVTSHPISLAALCAMRVSFPEFYEDLQEDPSLLHRFTDVVVRGRPLADQPLPTQRLMKMKYEAAQAEVGELGAERDFNLAYQHRPLRTFLASLNGVRWPDSLQRFLLLSEDPIARRFGEKAAAIHGSFVSGDTQGVLEGLGRRSETGPLSEEEARLLHQMAEELRHDSDLRRVNANRVVADLVDRLPSNLSQLLIGSLCRDLGESQELRSQIGLAKIGKLLARAHVDDRRAVASRLVEDVLTIEEDVRLSLGSMEPPNLDEAIEFTRKTLDLALPIRRDHGLDPSADDQLLRWLPGRTIRSGGRVHQLEFSELDGWVAEHEEHLLAALSAEYTEALAVEIETGGEPGIDLEAAIDRARKVFGALWEAGEETRETLWEQLTRYISLPNLEAARLAWEVAEEHRSGPTAEQVSTFLTAFIEQLSTRLEEEEEEEEREGAAGEPTLELDGATEALLALVGERLRDLDSTVIDRCARLAISWSAHPNIAADAHRLARQVFRSNVETSSGSILEEWIPRLLNDLPVECVRFLATEYPQLAEPRKRHMLTVIRVAVDTPIDGDQGGRYAEFIQHLPEESWGEEQMQGHLNALLPQLAQRAEHTSHLERVFQPVVPLLKHGAQEVVGNTLDQLFTDAKQHPRAYSMLHGWMVGHWPTASEQTGTYNPEQLLRDGEEFARTHPVHATEQLLRSLADMVDRGVVSGDLEGYVTKAALSVWTASPEQAVGTIEKRRPKVAPGQAANLVDPIDWSDDNYEDQLGRAWLAILSAGLSAEDRLQTTRLLLNKGLQGPVDEEPDRALRVWLDVQSETYEELLPSVLFAPETTDPQRRRLWQDLTARSEETPVAGPNGKISRVSVAPSPGCHSAAGSAGRK